MTRFPSYSDTDLPLVWKGHEAPPRPVRGGVRHLTDKTATLEKMQAMFGPSFRGILKPIRERKQTPTQLRRDAAVADMIGQPVVAQIMRDEAEAQEAARRIRGIRALAKSKILCPLCGGTGRIEDNPCWRCNVEG